VHYCSAACHGNGLRSHAITCPVLAKLSSVKGGHAIKSTALFLVELLAIKTFPRTCGPAALRPRKPPTATSKGSSTLLAGAGVGETATTAVMTAAAAAISQFETCNLELAADVAELERRVKKMILRSTIVECTWKTTCGTRATATPAATATVRTASQIGVHSDEIVVDTAGNSVWSQFERLCDHPLDPEYLVAHKKAFRAVLAASVDAWGNMATCTETDLARYVSKIESNSFRMSSQSSPKRAHLGRMIFPQIAMFNHSCAPNCEARYRSPTHLSIVTVREVAPGEELTISYIDETMKLKQRSAALTESYCFRCECAVCRTERGAARNSGSKRR